jgi:type II secretory ATPase GspE/PulE/Tfp pilus assembly ATPase PilB-like protein
MSDSIKELLKVTTDEHTIKTQLEREGLKTIGLQLKEMLLLGETSLDEAIRIGLGHA